MGHWRKLGQIFLPDGSSDWMHTHAMIPVVEAVDGDLVRIWFSSRDRGNRSHGAYLHIDMRDPLKVEYLHPDPVLEPGALGCFDDSGALPNAIIEIDGRKRLYYTGINLGVTVKIRNSIGIAEWNEARHRFERIHPGPVIDRTPDFPHFVATPEVIADKDGWRAWYTACQRWEPGESEAKHFYNLETCWSRDGVTWNRTGEIAIDFESPQEYALGVPRVRSSPTGFDMWFCARARPEAETYRIRYARSDDGRQWHRDPGVELDVSDAGWDSEMVCYPFIFDHAGERYMFYNGNAYGRTGIGIAVLDS